MWKKILLQKRNSPQRVDIENKTNKEKQCQNKIYLTIK